VNGNHDLRADGDPEQTLVADRYGSIVDLYVLLQRPDGKILLLERSGTGYADGQLCPPSGHLEAGESVVQGVVREAREETGVLIEPGDLIFRHVIHHRNPLGQARIGSRDGCARACSTVSGARTPGRGSTRYAGRPHCTVTSPPQTRHVAASLLGTHNPPPRV
jgi:8-oxo-dGTP pyrophosphatase MutT (NUDIX family)